MPINLLLLEKTREKELQMKTKVDEKKVINITQNQTLIFKINTDDKLQIRMIGGG